MRRQDSSSQEDIRDHITKAIFINYFSSPVDDVRVVNGNNLLGTRFGAEHGENARATSDIQHNLVLEEALVIVDEVTIGIGADGIFEHGLVDCCRLR